MPTARHTASLPFRSKGTIAFAEVSADTARPDRRTNVGGGLMPNSGTQSNQGSMRTRRGKGRFYPKGRQLDTAAVLEIEDLLAGRERRRDLLIEHLHRIQDRYGCLSAKHLAALADRMGLSQAEVYEVRHLLRPFRRGQGRPGAATAPGSGVRRHRLRDGGLGRASPGSAGKARRRGPGGARPLRGRLRPGAPWRWSATTRSPGPPGSPPPLR